MSTKIALSHPESINGFIALSGMLLFEDLAPYERLSSYYKHLKGYYGHGGFDNVLSIEKGRECKNVLLKANIKLTYNEYKNKASNFRTGN